MGRTKRIAVDESQVWQYVFDYTFDYDPQAGALDNVDGFNVSFVTAGDLAVWGRGLITSGFSTEAQLLFMEHDNPNADLANFPGSILFDLGYQPSVSAVRVGATNSFELISFDFNVSVRFELFGPVVSGQEFSRPSQSSSIYYGDGDDSHFGTGEDETVFGNGGKDIIVGGGGASDLHGGKGNDTIRAGSAFDNLYGEEGNDVITIRPGNYADGGAGDDIVTSGVSGFVLGGTGKDTLVIDLTTLTPVVDDNGARAVEVSMHTFTDPVLGSMLEVNQTLGAAGFETVIVRGGANAEIVWGSDLDEKIDGGGGNDSLSGGYGNDRLNGGGGRDVMFGDYGDDILIGGGGGDTLEGGVGVDMLYGGAGNDIYYIDDADDHVFETAGPGSTKDAGGSDEVRSIISFDLNASAGTAGIEKLTLEGVAAINGAGNIRKNTITGNPGDNVLLGRGGADLLKGMNGNDVLNGGSGNDVLVGGAGRDMLTGGDGSDVFRFGPDDFAGLTGATADLITDFKPGTDHVDLTGIDSLLEFIGTAAFTGLAGQLRAEVVDGVTLLLGDLDGDANADFAIAFQGATTLTGADIDLAVAVIAIPPGGEIGI